MNCNRKQRRARAVLNVALAGVMLSLLSNGYATGEGGRVGGRRAAKGFRLVTDSR